ncbi:MAG: hypothetical protein IKA39_03600 [Clostridia bacterium]|nr:hypothetical protein [Clostridia bacterium]
MNILAATIPLYIPILLYALGIIHVVIEMFTLGFGPFGLVGIICLIAGIVVRFIAGATTIEIILTILGIVALLGVMLSLTAKSAKSGKLSKSAIILNQSAVPFDKTEGTDDYTYLLGKEGITTTFLRPVGKAKVDDEIVEVINEDATVIEQGEKVLIVKVEGQKVIVRKI